MRPPSPPTPTPNFITIVESTYGHRFSSPRKDITRTVARTRSNTAHSFILLGKTTWQTCFLKNWIPAFVLVCAYKHIMYRWWNVFLVNVRIWRWRFDIVTCSIALLHQTCDIVLKHLPCDELNMTGTNGYLPAVYISYSASHDNWCTATLWNRIMTAQCEGMGEVGSARYEPALLPPCPSIRVLSYSNCQEIHSRQQTGLAV